MATEQEQAEAMRQMVGAALKQVGSDLEGFQKKAKDASSEGGGLISLNSLITGMTKNLTGPVGLAGAIYSAAKSLESFAVGRVQLQNFSTDVGASVRQINAMSAAMDKAGISVEESTQTIAKMGRLVSDLRAHGFGSELGRELLEAGIPANEIQQLIETAKTNFDKAINDTNAILRRGNEEYRFHMSERVHIAESHLAAISHTNEELGKIYESDLEAARKYHEAYTERALQISNTWAWLNDQFTKAFVHGGENRQKIIEEAFPSTGPDSPAGKAARASGAGLPDWMNRIAHPIENKQWPFSGSQGIGDILQHGSGAFPPQQATPNSAVNDRFGTWPKEMVDIGRSSDKTLIEMRDSLLRIETGGGGSGEGVPQATHFAKDVPGGGRAMLAQRLGIGTSEATGTRADRNNNPGNLKFGPLAKSFGATHADDRGFAVFPDRKSGSDAQDSLLKSDAYKGLTLDQFAGKYAEGSKDWARTVGKELGIGAGDIVNNQDPRLPGAIQKAEGAGVGGGDGGGAVPAEILDKAKAVALRGGPGAVSQFMASQGYPKAGAWCGEFAASVVKSVGGKPPAGAAVASNWRKWGEGVEGVPHPGDIAVRRGVATGQTGSHVTIVENVDPRTGRFTGLGGNQGRGFESSFPLSQYTYRRGAERATADRATVDRTQSAAAAPPQDANMNASIDFKNMPSWVKTAVDDNGKFKNLRVSRSTPQAGKASSTAGDQQPWSYE